jgi:hypothetical protein
MYAQRSSRWLAIFVAFALALTPALANAKKPDMPGGGGGGGNDGGGGETGGGILIEKLDDAGGTATQGRAWDVNDFREVVGTVRTSSGEDAAAHWVVTEVDGVIESSLSLLSGGCDAFGINDVGEIVGKTYNADGTSIALYWPAPTSAPIELPPLPGHDVSVASSINNDGLICGYVSVSGQEDWQADRAVVWRVTASNDGPVISDPVELPAGGVGSSAQDVNDNDDLGVAQVVGTQRDTQTPLLWEVQSLPDGTLSVASTPQVLDVGAFATGINNGGQVCGRTDVDAVVWSAGSVSILDRPGRGKNKVPRAWAWDIGDSGIIVGEAGESHNPRACVWDSINGSLTYLDDHLDSGSPLQGLNSAEAVNFFGDIVGNGWTGAFIAISPSP